MIQNAKNLVSLLEDQLTEADTRNAEVGLQRERNHSYYALGPIGNEREGASRYVSPAVHDVVESKKAYFSEVFLSTRQPIRFIANGQGRQADADARTAYVNYQLKKNQYEELFRDGWHDAFVAKRMVVLIEWEEEEDELIYPINQPVTALQIQTALGQDPKITRIDTDGMQEQPVPGGVPVYTGELKIYKQAGYAKMMLMQPERYYRDSTVTYVKDASYAGYDQELTKGELIRRGYDEDVVKRLKAEYRWKKASEDHARKSHDGSYTQHRGANRAEMQQQVTFVRTVTWLDLTEYDIENFDAPAGERLWEIHWSNGDILTKDGVPCIYERPEMPFFEWTEHKISHAAEGMATADVVWHNQKTDTILKRLILENQQRANNPRYEAVAGAVKSPRDLIAGRIGSVVFTTRQGSVKALEQPQLSPHTFSVVEMMARDKEERAGSSRLSQGMNNDALRYQNASDMIERLTNNANRRIIRAARDFAFFMCQMAQYIYRLGARNDDQVHTLEVAGRWVQIRPQDWNEAEWPMEIHKALTPDEGAKHAAMLLQMYGLLASDQSLGLLFGLEEKHAMLDDIFDSYGVADTSKYIARPDQSDPRFVQRAQAQGQQAQMQQQMQMQAFGAEIAEKQTRIQIDQFEASLKAAQTQADIQNLAQDNEREDEKFEHEKEMDAAELEIERTQKRAAALGNTRSGTST